jgi:hypothetical protein
MLFFRIRLARVNADGLQGVVGGGNCEGLSWILIEIRCGPV